jgi:DNA-binding NarL/FixJ family response regulator
MKRDQRKIHVLIADDHAVVREGIKAILSEAPDMVVVGEATDGVEALEGAARHLPDIVVLDVQMPRGGGLETLRALRRAHPGMAVLILSFHSETVLGVPFLREGASGYLAKDNAREALLDAIRTIDSGRKYVTEAVAEALARRLTSSQPASPHDRLSAQELIVRRCRLPARPPKTSPPSCC